MREPGAGANAAAANSGTIASMTTGGLDWGRVLPESALVAGAGATARHLKSPVALRLAPQSAEVSPGTLVDAAWVVHPGLAGWLKAAGAKDAAGGLRLSARAAAILETAATVRHGAPRRGLVRPGLRVVGSVLRAEGPELTSGVPAWEALEQAGAHRGFPVLGEAGWFELARNARGCLVAAVRPGDPTRVHVGQPDALTRVEPAAAMARLAREQSGRWTAVDAATVDLADMELAAEAGRTGLSAFQDLSVSRLLATEVGAVLALPPGSGKTVVVAAALSEGPERASVVLAPVGLLGQWQAELARWAPGRSVLRCTSAKALPDRIPAGSVVLTSLDIGAHWLASGLLLVDDLVVDEAAALLPDTRRARALRRARASTRRAWALTGTPSERSGEDDVRRLVGWARGAYVDAAVPAADLHPALLDDAAVGVIPRTRVEVLQVRPGREDAAWLAELAARTSESKGAFEKSRMSALARRGLGDPAGAGSDTRSAKRLAAAGRTAEHVACGGSVLMFTESSAVAAAALAELEQLSVRGSVLDSSLGRLERTRVLAAFAAGDLPVLVVTPAGQRGVNLQRADLVVHLDLPDSLAQFTQRNARAARMGSVHARVDVIVPVLEGTWDERWTQAFLQGASDPLSVL